MTKLLGPETQDDLKEAAASWTALSNAFLRRQRASSGERKVKRLASKHWLAAVDHLLDILAIGGIKKFATPAGYWDRFFDDIVEGNHHIFSDEAEPCLAMVIDQGSVGWSPSYYCMYHLRLRYITIFDVLHRVWNSLKSAFVSAGFWDIALLYGLHSSVNCGPFDGARFGEEVKSAAAHHQSLASSERALFQHYLPAIAMDRQEPDAIFEEEWIEHMWDLSLYHPKLQQKGPKMALSRWMSVIDIIKYWDDIFHLRLLRLLYLGLQMGYVSGDLANCHFTMPQAPVVSSSMAASTRNSKVSIGKLRDQCKNSLHLATMVFLEPNLQRSGSIMLTFTHSIREVHGQNATDLRGHRANIEWNIRMSSGSLWPVLSSCFEQLRDSGAMKYTMFTTDLSRDEYLQIAADSAIVADEDSWAAKCAGLSLQCVSHLVRVGLFWTSSYLGAFAGLLSPDPVVQTMHLERVKDDWETFVAAKQKTIPMIKNMISQSCFS